MEGLLVATTTRHRLPPAAAVVIAAVATVAACGGEAEPPAPDPFVARPATLADLTGPWRAQPLRLSEEWANRVDTACRRLIEHHGGPPAVIDARGAGVALVRYTGESAGSCAAIHIPLAGDPEPAGGGWSGGPEALRPLDDFVIADLDSEVVQGGRLTVQGWSIVGRFGAGLARVVIQPVGRDPVITTLGAGWFAGWWPARPGDPDPKISFPRYSVQGYDAGGFMQYELSR